MQQSVDVGWLKELRLFVSFRYRIKFVTFLTSAVTLLRDWLLFMWRFWFLGKFDKQRIIVLLHRLLDLTAKISIVTRAFLEGRLSGWFIELWALQGKLASMFFPVGDACSGSCNFKRWPCWTRLIRQIKLGLVCECLLDASMRLASWSCDPFTSLHILLNVIGLCSHDMAFWEVHLCASCLKDVTALGDATDRCITMSTNLTFPYATQLAWEC